MMEILAELRGRDKHPRINGKGADIREANTKETENLRYELRTITPEMAEAYLKTYNLNRPLRRSHVDMLVSQMRETAEFEPHPQSITFSAAGELLDGQHRMHAIMKLGRPVRMICGIGFPAESFHYMDSGVGRTPADRLNGVLSRRIIEIMRIHMIIRNPWVVSAGIIGSARNKFTPGEYIAFYDNLRAEYEIVEPASRTRKYFGRSEIHAALVELAICNPLKATALVEGMCELIRGEQPTNPYAYALREAVDSARIGRLTGKYAGVNISRVYFHTALSVFRRCLEDREIKTVTRISPWTHNKVDNRHYIDWGESSGHLAMVESAIKGER